MWTYSVFWKFFRIHHSFPFFLFCFILLLSWPFPGREWTSHTWKAVHNSSQITFSSDGRRKSPHIMQAACFSIVKNYIKIWDVRLWKFWSVSSECEYWRREFIAVQWDVNRSVMENPILVKKYPSWRPLSSTQESSHTKMKQDAIENIRRADWLPTIYYHWPRWLTPWFT